MLFLVNFIQQTVQIFVSAAPFLLVGFFLAGVLRVLIPTSWLQATIGKNDFRSVLLASLAGVPLPLCSCSVLPTAAAIRQGGASKGATVSFLISTPETGVDSISITYALLDPVMTVARPLSAFATAMVAGLATNVMTRREASAEENAAQVAETRAPEDTCAANPSGFTELPQLPGSRVRLRTICDYAYGQLLDHIVSYFLIGLLISGFIGALIPDGALENPLLSGLPAMLLMLVIGIPLYVCATSSTPVAAMLMLKGLSPGAALVFLLAGPATNSASLAVVTKLLGKRVMVVYLASVAILSLVAGAIVNTIYLASDLSPQAVAGAAGEVMPLWIEIPATLVFLALVLRSAQRVRLLRGWREGLSRLGRKLGFNLGGRAAATVVVLLIAALYLATGLSVVGPGEAGWVVTFGEVTRTISSPGLVFHWPYPVARLVTEPGELVRSVDRGFRQGGAAPPAGPTLGRTALSSEEREFTKEAEIADGDENLLAIRYSVQYSVLDAYAYHFVLDDPDGLVANLAEYAVRRVMCEEPTDSILVNHHIELAGRMAAQLRTEVAALTPGIRILRVDLLDMHAPPEVHFSFRDVASAMEDQHRFIRQAESYRNRVTASGRAQSYSLESAARAEKTTRVATAAGEAYGFAKLEEASRPVREITRLRMQLDAVGRTLGPPRLIVPLTDMPLDLWIDQNSMVQRWTDVWGSNAPATPSPTPSPTTGGDSQETWREKLKRLEESQR